MRGFGSFVRKEFVEIVRTWRIWVLPGMVLFFAITGPVLAKATPEILKAVMSSQPGGAVITLPAPTYLDSYGQWVKNLSQIVVFAVIIIYGGLVSSEKKSGTAALVLTKPVSRQGFVTAKALVHAIFVVVTVVVGALVTWGLTLAVFGTASPGPLWTATGGWLAFGLFFLGVMTLLSVLMGSQAGAAGAGLVVYMVIALSAIWRPLADRSPAGLVGGPAAIAAGKVAPLLWPVLTSLALAAICVAAAAAAFRRQEL